jgi:hypothetical protein
MKNHLFFKIRFSNYFFVLKNYAAYWSQTISSSISAIVLASTSFFTIITGFGFSTSGVGVCTIVSLGASFAALKSSAC